MCRALLIALFVVSTISGVAAQQVLSATAGAGYNRLSDDNSTSAQETYTLGASLESGFWFVSVDLETYTAESEFTEVVNPTPGTPGYYWDTFDNGQRRCRSSATGQFVDSDYCGSSGYSYDYTESDSRRAVWVQGAGVLRFGQGHGSFYPRWILGPGVRIGQEGIAPYGSLALILPLIDQSEYTAVELWAKGSAGAGVTAGFVGVTFSLGN